jgi:hypothetical protein
VFRCVLSVWRWRGCEPKAAKNAKGAKNTKIRGKG